MRHNRDMDAPSETFHTRATPRRIPALHQDNDDGAWHANEHLTSGDLWFIAGPDRHKAFFGWNKLPARARLIARLAILPLVALLLLGMQGFVQQAARDCMDQHSQACLAFSIFMPMVGSQSVIPPTPTPKPTPAIPPVPDDLPANVHDFLALAMPYAVQAHQAIGWPTSVILAQWGLEHGWHVPDYTGYNWGNSGAIEGYPTVAGTNAPGSPGAFAYANTPTDGLNIFLHVARLSYYTAVAPAAAQGADAAAVALGQSPWDAGHYTNIGQPGSSLITIMRDFNFYRFDTN
jgi:hypothetical protein